jgi:hypothetical protein
MEKENQKSDYTLSAFSKTEHAAQKSLNTTGPCQASVAQRISGHNCAPGCGKKRVPFFALKETETALAKARNRSGREVPNTGWIFAGCLRSQASSMVSAVVSWRWAYFCTKRAVSFRSFSQCLCLDLLILKRADQRWRRISHNSARRISSPVKSG